MLKMTYSRLSHDRDDSEMHRGRQWGSLPLLFFTNYRLDMTLLSMKKYY